MHPYGHPLGQHHEAGQSTPRGSQLGHCRVPRCRDVPGCPPRGQCNTRWARSKGCIYVIHVHARCTREMITVVSDDQLENHLCKSRTRGSSRVTETWGQHSNTTNDTCDYTYLVWQGPSLACIQVCYCFLLSSACPGLLVWPAAAFAILNYPPIQAHTRDTY